CDLININIIHTKNNTTTFQYAVSVRGSSLWSALKSAEIFTRKFKKNVSDPETYLQNIRQNKYYACRNKMYNDHNQIIIYDLRLAVLSDHEYDIFKSSIMI